MKKEKIKLEKEMETLLITLYCKAKESTKDKNIICDTKAKELIDKIEYNYSQLKIPKQTYLTICMRAKQIDNYVNEFLKKHPNSIIVHMGCGLDSRFYRVDNNLVEWYDLDFPEVIDLRRKFYEETDRYHMIPSSVMEFNWFKKLSNLNKPFLFVAEGLLMYLKEKEVKKLILQLHKNFDGSRIIFDCYSILTAKNINRHPSIRKTGARIYWGLDDSSKIENWSDGIKLIEEWYFTQSKELEKLNSIYTLAFKVANLFPAAKKAHRILYYQL